MFLKRVVPGPAALALILCKFLHLLEMDTFLDFIPESEILEVEPGNPRETSIPGDSDTVFDSH